MYPTTMADEFIAGALGGVAKTMLAQPLDTMKTLTQCNRPIVGPGQLYRGVMFPLVNNTVFQAASLGIEAKLHKVVPVHAVAGALTGAICCAFSCPLDSWKVARQNGSRVMLRNAYRGLIPAIARESVASAVFFAAFGSLRRTTSNTTMSGAAAGLCATLVSLPIDTVKTRIQAGSSFKAAFAGRHYSAGLQYVVVKALLTNCGLLLCVCSKAETNKIRGAENVIASQFSSHDLLATTHRRGILNRQNLFGRRK